ncbi:MAG: VWA domain-containing protein [Byssovorax sp.]
MSFASPTFLVALLLLLPALIAFLVHRRREVLRVPSVLLFRLAARSAAPNRKIRKIRRLLALLACLAALAALVLAAARPHGRSKGETVAVVIDRSASMGAGGRRSPLQQARRFAGRMLASAGPEDRFVLIGAGAVPRRLAGPAAPGPLLDEALDALAPEAGGADLGAALSLAAELCAGTPSARIVLLGDGGESLGDGSGEIHGLPLTEKRFSPPSGDNLGITVCATRPPADAGSDDEREALIAVATSSTKARAARVILKVDDKELARRHLEIPPLGEAELTIRVHASSHRLAAHVEPEDGLADALDVDDDAALDEIERRPPRALLIAPAAAADGSGDAASAYFVEKALLAAGAKEVVHVSSGFDNVPLEPGDVLVALGEGPSRPVTIPALYLSTRTGVLPFKTLREIDAKETRLRSVDGRDALLRGVALDGLTIEHASTVDTPRGARALVELDGGTVVLAGGAGEGAYVYLGVDPAKSDLVLRVAFPVLVANSLGVLGGASRSAAATTVARAEIALRQASIMDRQGAEEAPEAPWKLPASPAFLLGIVAAALLALEALMFRKGWAD